MVDFESHPIVEVAISTADAERKMPSSILKPLNVDH